MKKQRQVEEDGLIITKFGGLHTFQDADRALIELSEINKDKNQIYEIVINDDDIKVDFTRREEELISERVKSTFQKFEQGALAIVADNDLVFGLSRMHSIIIKNERIAVAVFRSEKLAREWIQEIKEIQGQSSNTEE